MSLAAPVSRRAFGVLLLGGGVAGALPPALGGCAVGSAARPSRDGLPRSSPGDQGVDARAVLGLLDEAMTAGLELHSFMLYRHGHVVAEGWWWPYGADRRHMMHSLTKSVTACGVGLAIAEGRFGLVDKVVELFPDELPAYTDPRLASMTVRDLLTMQSGHGAGVSGSVWRQITTSWVTEFFKLPIVHQPGTTFVYNSASSFMLSALVTRTSGQTLREYLEPRFFQPLGIGNLEWDLAPGGINPGGNGLSWTTLDSLKLGIVHLYDGRWQGRQILPAAWVRAATLPQVPGGRYGYQWWIGPGRDCFYAWGLFGQFSYVFPEHDAVLAITAGTRDEKLPELVQRYFPGAFAAARRSDAADATLRTRCARLRVLAPLVPTDSPLAAQISGHTFDVHDNEDSVTALRFEFARGRCRFFLRDARGEHSIAVGLRDWIESETSMTGGKLHHQYQPERMRVTAGGRWLDERTFEMIWQFVETAFQDRVVCRFEGDTLRFDRSVNVNSAATSRPTLTGKMVRSPSSDSPR